MKKFYSVLAVLTAVSLTSYASIAHDDSGNLDYAGGSFAGLNDGYGFGAWIVSGTGGGSYVDMANRGTTGFRLWADDGANNSAAVRNFDSALSAGHTFSLNLGHFGGNNGQVGISLLSAGAPVFNINISSGASYWSGWDGGTSFDLNGDEEEGMADYFTTDNNVASFTFTYDGGNNYGFSLKDEGGNGFEASNYTAGNDISAIDGVTFYNNGQGGGKNFYVDQLTVIPEPATVGLLGLFGSSLAWFRKRFSA